jgi:bifunctional UDP-N-acetylglucosamine pyrophosphorylase/glucosamine-1-phosphate N-acetyltransferase
VTWRRNPVCGKFATAPPEAGGIDIPAEMTNPKRGAADGQLAVVVLAAGRGTRMQSDVPKALHAVAGRTLLDHVIDSVRPLRPDRIILVVPPDAEFMAVADPSARVVVQAERRGTGDAVERARPELKGFVGDVLVVFVDTPLLETATLRAMFAARATERAPAVVVLGFETDQPAGYGRLLLNEDGELGAVVEHADATAEQREILLCNSGMMLVDGGVLYDLLDEVGEDNAKKERYLTDIVASAAARGLGCAVVRGNERELMGVNTRADLAEAEAVAQERLRAAAMAGGATLIDPLTVYFSFDTRLGRDVVVEPGVFFGRGVTVGERTRIKAYCHIEGAKIGANVSIGPFARLRAGADLGAESRVGNFVEVKNAALGKGAKANHLSYVGDADVGEHANIGAGAITCNYDGYKKSRTVIGEGAFIGSNTALVAPVRVGAGAVVGAGSTITRDVSEDSLALTRRDQKEISGWSSARRSSKKKAV